MASGTVNSLEQIGLAAGVAALGALHQAVARAHVLDAASLPAITPTPPPTCRDPSAATSSTSPRARALTRCTPSCSPPASPSWPPPSSPCSARYHRAPPPRARQARQKLR
jgi:hypothetical protein